MAQSSATRRPGASPRTIAVGALAAIIVAIIIGSIFVQAQGPTQIDATNTQLVAEGRLVYQASCASCHGAALEGQPNWQEPGPDGIRPAPPHDETGHTWHHNDAYLFATTKYGGAATSPTSAPNGMPGFEGVLSDRQIWAVLSYIKSTWPPEIQEAQERGHD